MIFLHYDICFIPNPLLGTIGIITFDDFDCCIHGPPKIEKIIPNNVVLPHFPQPFLFSVFGTNVRTRLSFYNSIHMDAMIMLFRLSNIASFNFRVIRDFQYPALKMPVFRAKVMAYLRRENAYSFLPFS